jgi:pimeloyl-ACP methyl ester carboxylesterase
MPGRPILLLHGYSDTARSFGAWESNLEARGYDVTASHTANYRTLTNEISIEDIAEGLDRALRRDANFNSDQEFDVIVHSTGMLVIRAWLATYGSRLNRVKHLIGLAPASFGSPLAQKGRSLLGSVFKGSKDILSPDFLEAGDRVLDALELGSSFTWELASRDLLGPNPVFSKSADTPFAFIFCGDTPYKGLRKFVNSPGTDGTVRWSGCALNTRKLTIDLTKAPGESRTGDTPTMADRVFFEPTEAALSPLIPVANRDHGTILTDPEDWLVGMVDAALQVSTLDQFEAWKARAEEETKPVLDRMEKWQQFVIRATDDRGHPVRDWAVELFENVPNGSRRLREFELDVHKYEKDPSLRCFHVRLDDFKDLEFENLWMRLTASSGTELVGYYGIVDEDVTDQDRPDPSGFWEGAVNVSHLLGGVFGPQITTGTSDSSSAPARPGLFYPFTTTLIELRLNREPLPISSLLENRVTQLLQRQRG